MARDRRSDETLLVAVRRGDSGAFAELYRRHAEDLLRFARTRLSVEDAEEVVSESFARTLHAIESGAGPVDHPIRYLMVVARTVASQIHRGTRRRLNADERAMQGWQEACDARSSSEASDDLLEAFSQLRPRWRTVLWMIYVEGWSPTLVGERFGLSAEAVRALALRARRALREHYVALQSPR